jgi:hypothetical protein
MIIMRIVLTQLGLDRSLARPGDAAQPPNRAASSGGAIGGVPPTGACNSGCSLRAEDTGAAVIFGAICHCPLPNWKSGLTF